MIEILKNEKWRETGWESFEQMEGYTGNVQKTWSDNNYNYIAVEFSIDNTFELFRQNKEKVLSVEKRYELGADLIKLAEKYAGLKKKNGNRFTAIIEA